MVSQQLICLRPCQLLLALACLLEDSPLLKQADGLALSVNAVPAE